MKEMREVKGRTHKEGEALSTVFIVTSFFVLLLYFFVSLLSSLLFCLFVPWIILSSEFILLYFFSQYDPYPVRSALGRGASHVLLEDCRIHHTGSSGQHEEVRASRRRHWNHHLHHPLFLPLFLFVFVWVLGSETSFHLFLSPIFFDFFPCSFLLFLPRHQVVNGSSILDNSQVWNCAHWRKRPNLWGRHHSLQRSPYRHWRFLYSR